MLKSGVVGAVVAAAVWGALELLFNLSNFLAVVIGVAVGAVAVVVLLARSRGESATAVAREVVTAASAVVTEPRSTTEERAAHEQLLRAVTSFVTSGAAQGSAVPVRELVETLRGMLPRAIGFAPDSETTFNVLKLAREDLPKQLRAFSDMSSTDWTAKRSDLEAQLRALKEKLEKLGAIIDRGRSDQFDAESAFINLKFN